MATREKLDYEWFLAELAQAPRAALLLDYDGTLAPFCEERESAVPYPGVSALLRQIMTAGRTRVVIITGRPAQQIIPLIGLHPCPEIWGSHGRERLKPDGSCEISHAEVEGQQALARAALWLEQVGLQHLAEHKPGGLALHWRGLKPAVASDAKQKLLAGWVPLAHEAGMLLEEFDGGVEMRLPGGSKADAVCTILKEMGEGVAVAHLGDDQADEEAFRALKHRGLTVLVRPQWRPTAAELWLRPPQELLEFLSQWLRARKITGPTTG